MLRVSLIAVAAVMLAACDDDSDTAVTETEVEVVEQEADAPAETEVAAETETQTEEGTDVTVLTSDSPAVETEIRDVEEVEATETGDTASAEGADSASGSGSEGTDESFSETTEAPLDEASAEAEGTDGQQMAAADPGAEQVSTSEAGDASEAMQRYEDWVLGRWAEDGMCDERPVVMEENAMSLPGGVTCDSLAVSEAGEETLVVAGSSCQGAGDTSEVEIEVARSGDGLTFTRNGQQAELSRCE